MKRHLVTKMVASLAIAVVGLCSASASAQVSLHLEDFTTNQTTLFTFGAFDDTNATFGPDGLTTNIPVGAVDNFGGIGVAAPSGQSTVSLDGLTSIEVTLQAEPGNVSDVVLSIREGVIGGAPADDGEFFSFTIPAASFAGGGFQTVSIDPTTGFNGDFPANPGSDGVLNGLLNNTGIQTPFGGNDLQNVTVQSVNFIGGPAEVIPEPSSLALLMGLGSVIAIRRRRA